MPKPGGFQVVAQLTTKLIKSHGISFKSATSTGSAREVEVGWIYVEFAGAGNARNIPAGVFGGRGHSPHREKANGRAKRAQICTPVSCSAHLIGYDGKWGNR